MKNLTEMYLELRTPIFRFLMRLCGNHNLAEELTQETFYRALVALPKFRKEASLKTWLYSIARNTYLNKIRSRSNDFLPYDVQEVLSSEIDKHDPGKLLIEKEQRRLVKKAVYSLPEAFRTVIILKEFEELSYEEIADILGKSENWVRVTFFRAKQKLKEIYSDMEGRKEDEH